MNRGRIITAAHLSDASFKVAMFMLVWAGLGASRLPSAEPVRARIGKDVAWTGEGVPLVVTLHSPGPFSGAASFDLPDMSQTVIVGGDRPVVGSETVDGETYFTQRYTFTVYTQRSGAVVIPRFRIRFAGKPNFTSDPEPIVGMTPQLEFESKRPPASEDSSFVIAVSKLETKQQWSPESIRSLSAGDVLERRIEQRADGTTAMLMTPISAEAPSGVRVYRDEPTIEDSVQRGESVALRRDTVKYQFERAGTYSIPDVAIEWWDTDSFQMHNERLGGTTVTVTELAVAELAADERTSPWFLIFGFGLTVLLVWLLRKPIVSLIASHTAPSASEAVQAAKRLNSACRSNDPTGAYRAAVNWKRIVATQWADARTDTRFRHAEIDFAHELENLSRHMYGRETDKQPWSGASLASSFAHLRRALRRAGKMHGSRMSLPAINPTGVDV